MAAHFQFFKNALVYRLSRDMSQSLKLLNLHDAMVKLLFSPCGSQDMVRTGWKSNGDIPEIIHRTTDMLITVVRESKNIPNTVIKEALNAKVAKLEADQGRKLKKTEKDSIKDEVLHQLIPRAFTSTRTTQIWIDLKESRIVVDTGSARQAEDALAFLRKTLGSLPVVPLTLENPVELTMTDWLKKGLMPQGFEALEEVELKAILEDGGVVRAKKQDLHCDEITTHLDAGKVVTRLALDWQKRVSFILDDSATLKRLKFCDELVEQNSDVDVEEDACARRYADFMLMCDELRTVINDTIAALGGEAKR